jgi:hypothetical protein
VGDEPSIHIESKVTTKRGGADAKHGAPGPGGSASRVVREPGRWSRLVAVVALVGLVAGGLLWWAGDRGPGGDDGAGKPPSGISMDRRPTRIAFFEAVTRLGQAGSFAYGGEVHAAEQNSLRPGDRTAGDFSVEGAVLLGHGLTRDLAVDSTGRAVETVTSGPTVWTRRASTVDGLTAAPWEFRTVTGRTVLGTAAVTVLVLSAKDPREEAPDPAGRRVIHATVPAADRPAGYGDLLVGADVLLTLDEGGDVARIVVRSAPDDPELVLELDIAQVGEPQTIAPPHSGNAGLRRTVPIDELEAAGVRPLELGQAPAGWTLTGAWVGPGPVGPAGCPRLNLSYRDPHAVSDNFMRLLVTSPMCGGVERGIGAWGPPQPLSAGVFEGTVIEAAAGTTTGDLVNGTTRVGFLTDLSAEDAATVLASLRPFDAATELTPLAGIPSA